jgi:hypothetical protein
MFKIIKVSGILYTTSLFIILLDKASCHSILGKAVKRETQIYTLDLIFKYSFLFDLLHLWI